MTDPLAETRAVIRYTDPADLLDKLLWLAQHNGLVRGTGVLYHEGERTLFTEWTVEPNEDYLE